MVVLGNNSWHCNVWPMTGCRQGRGSYRYNKPMVLMPIYRALFMPGLLVFCTSQIDFCSCDIINAHVRAVDLLTIY